MREDARALVLSHNLAETAFQSALVKDGVDAA